MAIRYCGPLAIDIRYNEVLSHYRCDIFWLRPKQTRTSLILVTVGEPRVLEHAVDSKEAYDRVAHAAVSFFEEIDPVGLGWAKEDGCGWHISRQREVCCDCGEKASKDFGIGTLRPDQVVRYAWDSRPLVLCQKCATARCAASVLRKPTSTLKDARFTTRGKR